MVFRGLSEDSRTGFEENWLLKKTRNISVLKIIRFLVNYNYRQHPHGLIHLRGIRPFALLKRHLRTLIYVFNVIFTLIISGFLLFLYGR